MLQKAAALHGQSHLKPTLWKGAGVACGPVNDLYSSHAEAFGIFSALCFLLQYICNFPVVFPIHSPIKVICDNQGVLQCIEQLKEAFFILPIWLQWTTLIFSMQYIKLTNSCILWCFAMSTFWDIKIDIALFINYPWKPSLIINMTSGLPCFFQSFSVSDWYTLVFPLQVHHYSFMAIWLFETINWSYRHSACSPDYCNYLCQNTTGELVIVQRSIGQLFPLPSGSSKLLIKLVSKSSCTTGFRWMHRITWTSLWKNNFVHPAINTKRTTGIFLNAHTQIVLKPFIDSNSNYIVYT